MTSIVPRPWEPLLVKTFNVHVHSTLVLSKVRHIPELTDDIFVNVCICVNIEELDCISDKIHVDFNALK